MQLQWIVVTRTSYGHPVLSFGPFKTAEDALTFMQTDMTFSKVSLSDWACLCPHIPVE